MSNNIVSLNLQTSEHFFKLTTEAIRILSNKSCGYCTISDTIGACVGGMKSNIKDYSPALLKDHLRLIPSVGTTSVHIQVLDTTLKTYNDLTEPLSKVLGESATFVDAISIALLDLIVEHNTTRMLERLGLTGDQAKEYRDVIHSHTKSISEIRL